jgi:hypothetical protein
MTEKAVDDDERWKDRRGGVSRASRCGEGVGWVAGLYKEERGRICCSRQMVLNQSTLALLSIKSYM